MKYFYYLILFAFFYYYYHKEKFNVSFKIHKLNVWIAKSKKQLKKGLMYKTHIPKNYGMLFNYNKYGNHSFWMKNTLIPLDLIFLSHKNTVIDFIQNLKPHSLNSNKIDKPSYNVIETNNGWIERNNVNIGDRIKYTKI